MLLYSTKNKELKADLKTAVLQGLPEDNGLYMPESIPRLPASFIENIKQYSFQEIAYTVCKALLGTALPDKAIKRITEQAISFPAPLVSLDTNTHILELFHGPSLAFKDFGARFMAQLMGYFNEGNKEKLIILVATSGDTGGAVASGFLGTPGIEVVILYPSEKVSLLQEKQLTTLGQNIKALEVKGTFDDCQSMVKQAFLDTDLNRPLRLSSANSINIARLIPQSLYYFEAYKQLDHKPEHLVFCVPSGNFGNLTAGLLAKEMGLPIDHFIAATNRNDVVPEYLETGEYRPRPSLATLSNAMDVGNPSNYARMYDLFQAATKGSTWNNFKESISGYAFSDEATEKAMQEIEDRHQYTIDPHGAVAYLALRAYQQSKPETSGILLETAHPAKFKPDVERILGKAIDVPERLAELANKPKEAKLLENNYSDFKEWLLHNYQ